ncbi:MlaD family protein [Nocardioides ultimimeridianus]
MSMYRVRTPVAVVVTVALACVIGFFYLWNRAGGHMPGRHPYLVSFDATDVKSLQPDGDVREAGVLVGKVDRMELGDGTVHVTLALNGDGGPVHAGTKVRIGVKSVIGQTMVVLKDGNGQALSSGSVLPASSVEAPVDVDEIFKIFTPHTRKALASALTSAGVVTGGTQESFADLVDAVGILGHEGYTATDAIAAQSRDLTALVREATRIMASLNTNRTALASLISNAHTITAATAGQQKNLARTMQLLPGLMTSAKSATSSLGGLASDLDPVASDLNAAAPALNTALTQLPSASHSLRALLPSMNSSFKRSHATLTQVPTLATNLSAVAPQLDELVLNLNPMLAYIKPYAADIGSFFGNFGGAFDVPVENGITPARLAPIFSQFSLRGNPLNLQSITVNNWNNPYPSPLKAAQPSKYTGTYPRIQKEKETE